MTIKPGELWSLKHDFKVEDITLNRFNNESGDYFIVMSVKRDHNLLTIFNQKAQTYSEWSVNIFNDMFKKVIDD